MKQFFVKQTLILTLFLVIASSIVASDGENRKTSKYSISGSEVEYSVKNPTITGASQYIEFDLEIASLINNEDFYRGELYISYNSLTFGTNFSSKRTDYLN